MLTGLHYPSADLDEPGWSLVSAAVRTLEESWHQKNACDPATLLPAENNPHRPAVLLELLKVDQEFCWQSGERKQVEDYIAEWPELESNAEQVAELIEAECLTRAAAGEGIPTSEDIQHRFPQVWKRVHLAEVEQQARREKQSHQDTIDVAMVDTAIQPVVAPIPEPMPNPPAMLQPLAERYIPLQQLGEGGMGTVFRVHDKQLQREVALKIPRDEITNNPEARARFLKEARSAARIKHPNICTIYDTGEVDGTCFLTMELVNGPSLADQVQAGPIPSDQAAATVLKIALALAKIHEAKIIHRDIKPSNVMLGRYGEV
nr:serine/threonine protein kinase [Planctomycetota bacterium]